jgi:hypothetical protein
VHPIALCVPLTFIPVPAAKNSANRTFYKNNSYFRTFYLQKLLIRYLYLCCCTGVLFSIIGLTTSTTLSPKIPPSIASLSPPIKSNQTTSPSCLQWWNISVPVNHHISFGVAAEAIATISLFLFLQKQHQTPSSHILHPLIKKLNATSFRSYIDKRI